MEGAAAAGAASESGFGCVVAPLAGAVAAGAGVALVGRAWASCGIGVNAAANSFALLPLFLVAWVVHALWWAAALALGRRLAPRRRFGRYVGVALGAVGSLLLVWLLMAWQHAPDHYPATTCAPDNIPHWWPTWLPLH